jgi:hypothetical protein
MLRNTAGLNDDLGQQRRHHSGDSRRHPASLLRFATDWKPSSPGESKAMHPHGVPTKDGHRSAEHDLPY